MTLSNHSFFSEYPQRPQVLRSEWTPMKTPGPHFGQWACFRTSFPSSTLYFDHLAEALGLSPITPHPLRFLQPHPLLRQVVLLLVPHRHLQSQIQRDVQGCTSAPSQGLLDLHTQVRFQ